MTRDEKYGNSILHLSVKDPETRPMEISLSFEVLRREYIRRDPQDGEENRADLTRWLGPDRLVPLDDRVQALARRIVAGKASPLEKARAVYDHVVSTMRYDKTGTGWGRGDLNFACDYRRGNCTDFHALLIGLARAAGIPARFEIGFPLPEKHGEGIVSGYHCWAEIYVEGFGWVPVDASEASKHPEKREYFFGAHDENRVQLSVGRDIVLSPRQKGEPLNYFIYPYVEIDSSPLSGIETSFTYRDVSPGNGDPGQPARNR
jgi:transglutaminase-like putative cysteine protease